MRPIMVYLAKCGIRNMMYVADGRVGASSKQVWLNAAVWNGCPIKSLPTGITLSSVLPRYILIVVHPPPKYIFNNGALAS
jgi:hypothetical protein